MLKTARDALNIMYGYDPSPPLEQSKKRPRDVEIMPTAQKKGTRNYATIPREEIIKIEKEYVPVFTKAEIELFDLINREKDNNKLAKYINILEISLLNQNSCSSKTKKDYYKAQEDLTSLSGNKLERELKNKDIEEGSKRNYLACSIQAATSNEGALTHYRVNDWLKNFKVIGEPSAMGIIIEANYPSPNSSKNLFVLKVQKLDYFDEYDFYNEAMIGIYGLNRLKETIPNFVYTYGYTYCNNTVIGANNQVSLCSESGNVPFLITENIPNSTTLRKAIQDIYNYSDLDIKNLILQVFNAIALAEIEIDFTHNDLHTSNVLVSPLNRPMYIPFVLNTGYPKNDSYMNSGNYLASIIDFGYSSMKYQKSLFGRTDVPEFILNRTPSSLYDTIKFMLFVLNDITVRPGLYQGISEAIQEFLDYFVDYCRMKNINISRVRLSQLYDIYTPKVMEGQEIRKLPPVISLELKNAEERLYTIDKTVNPFYFTKTFISFIGKKINFDSFIYKREQVDKNYIYNYDNNKLSVNDISNIVTENSPKFDSGIALLDYIQALNSLYPTNTSAYIQKIKDGKLDLINAIQNIIYINKDVDKAIERIKNKSSLEIKQLLQFLEKNLTYVQTRSNGIEQLANNINILYPSMNEIYINLQKSLYLQYIIPQIKRVYTVVYGDTQSQYISQLNTILDKNVKYYFSILNPVLDDLDNALNIVKNKIGPKNPYYEYYEQLSFKKAYAIIDSVYRLQENWHK